MENITDEYLTPKPTTARGANYERPNPSSGPKHPNVYDELHAPNKQRLNIKFCMLVAASVICASLIIGLAAAQMWYLSTLGKSIDQLRNDIEALADRNRDTPDLSDALDKLTGQVESQRHILDTINEQMTALISACDMSTSSSITCSPTVGTEVPAPSSSIPTPTTAQSCGQGQMDIAFLIDSSGSINRNDPGNWGRLLEFVSLVVSGSTVGPNDNQFAVIKYSFVATVEFKLNAYSTQQAVVDHILGIGYDNSRTNIAAAIEFARKQIFTGKISDGDRASAQNVIILITDGVPNDRIDETLPQANGAKAEGILIISVGIADEIDVALLTAISSSNTFLSATDFNQLDNILGDLVGALC